MGNKWPNHGLFTSENQPKNRRGKQKRTLFLEALEKAGYSEDELIEKLVQLAFDGDSMAVKEVFIRLHPTKKPQYETVEFEYDKNDSPAEKAGKVLKAVSDGLISPDIGKLLIDSISNVVKIEEVTELKNKVENLYQQMGLNVE